MEEFILHFKSSSIKLTGKQSPVGVRVGHNRPREIELNINKKYNRVELAQLADHLQTLSQSLK